MNNKINNTSEYLENYIKANKDYLEETELKFFLKYLVSLKESKYENAINTDIKTIIMDLKKLYNNLSSRELTSLTYKRLAKELEIVNLISQRKNLEDISYELDKLYIECDMGVRENSVLVKRIMAMDSAQTIPMDRAKR